MKGIFSLLAKARLIELSADERALAQGSAAELPASDVTLAPAPAEPVPVAVPVAPAEGEIAEGKPLEEIFVEAGIPPTPFPAERLLRLLDGLRAMDAATRKTAVLAMDAADDNWQIGDPLVDAQRKIGALEGYKQGLQAHVRAAEEAAAAAIQEINARQESTAAQIRTQIHELEQLLEREVARSTQEIARLEAGQRAAHEAAAREGRRMDQEIERLREILAQFAQTSIAA